MTLARRFGSAASPFPDSSLRVYYMALPATSRAGLHDPMSQEPAIFVAIAAYRDPDLGPTIEDCLAKARHPERLRFGVCWQHRPGEVLGNWLAAPQFRVINVDWRDSRGHSWARAEAMNLYDGEDWYLQLDSHHRFVQDWDTKLITQASLTGSQKPLLSAPAPPVAGNAHQADLVHFKFTDFRPDGIPEHVIAYIPDHPGRWLANTNAVDIRAFYIRTRKLCRRCPMRPRSVLFLYRGHTRYPSFHERL